MATGDGDGEAQDIPARGIGIAQAYVNQGVPVTIVKDGEWADAGARERAIIQGRQTMVQALWAYADDFEPREIEARLYIDAPGMEQQIGVSKIMVDHESSQRIGDSFWWVLPGELMVPQAKFKIELFETEPGHEDDGEFVLPPWSPADGESNWIGVEDSYMKLKSLIVPIRHEQDGCSNVPEITEEDVEAMRKELAEYNPVDEAILELREEVTYTGSMESFGGVLQFLSSLRQQDGAPPEYYYYGLVRPCDGGASGVGGQAIAIPQQANKGNAWTRTSMGRWYGSGAQSAGTYVHEVGHSQGRYHVDCGGAGGPDPNYPYPGGNTETWGFANESFAGLPPSHKDYMSYCGPTWVSDYGWDLVFPRIQLISSWDLEGPGQDPDQPQMGTVLIGMLSDEGEAEHWFTTSGYVSAEEKTPGESLQLTTDTGLHELPAAIYQRGDAEGQTIAVQLPAEVDDLSAVIDAARISNELSLDVDVGAIKLAE